MDSVLGAAEIGDPTDICLNLVSVFEIANNLLGNVFRRTPTRESLHRLRIIIGTRVEQPKQPTLFIDI